MSVQLQERHEADLRRSGLSSATIEAAGFRSASAAEANHSLGRNDLRGFALEIPYPSLNGHAPFSRYRPDKPPTDRDGRKAKYLTAKGAGNRLYFPPILPESVLQDTERGLLLTEGEKKALKATQEGFPCIGLAGVWCFRGRDKNDESRPLADLDDIEWHGREVWIVFDSDLADKPEVQRAEAALAEELQRRGAVVRVVRLPNGPNGEKVGVDDYLVQHGDEGPAELRKLLREAKPSVRFVSGQARGSTGIEWPVPPDAAAYQGLAGELVRAIEPHTEADSMALLLQFLTGFGSIIGADAYYEVEGARHPARHNMVMVGESAKGRKGTAWRQVSHVLSAIDEEWATQRVLSGLSSGEGLIWAVRDPIEREEPIREGGKRSGAITGYETVVTDSGVKDKRLLVIESEYASVLRVQGREGNTLSPIIRQAWDDGGLRTLTKNSPAQATGAHISIIGHVTRDELLRYLDSTEQGNGFANRFLWVAVRRSKMLPEGGSLDTVDFASLIQRLTQAVALARGRGHLRFDEQSRSMWHAVYPDLSAGKAGLLGAVTARAEAHVVRLAVTYALLDTKDKIGADHLEAALAVWDYCERSAMWIFGNATGDPVSDQIMAALRLAPEGQTRTQLSALFGRNQKADRIHRAIEQLAAVGRITREDLATGGRRAELYKIVQDTN